MTVDVAQTRTCPDCGTALSIDGDSQKRCPVCQAEMAAESSHHRSESHEQSDRAEGVLDTLVDARLLTSYEVPAGNDESPHHRIEIVHESLLSHWPRLVR
ncbi:MAG: hypothetical protein P8Y44_08635, partial [Acidobacteriota bacterium]